MILQNVSEEAVAFDANLDLKSIGYIVDNLQPVNDSDTSFSQGGGQLVKWQTQFESRCHLVEHCQWSTT